ncbi:3-keto-5-aminohexanoate cleavage protein [Deinococcus deserti]|uniref:3-keto-5-aminohexanoate cleavage enzyme n=1 Tax=Deinococcus deserti (strain DSM 17065 / CIP 109153 / LMG 22923 / VCD115) TaxID=546414 RepID=C1D3M5_DEIDV|nr:3-keto-5-aminohexanoate cleavage protein [Deinococcus deserti]ACO48104.2 hypothetical protein Deide_3p01610 [Deinococcus deserti VCD115]
MFIQACLNGNRRLDEHPAVPIGANELARDAQAARVAGASAVHIHPRASCGRPSLDAKSVASAVSAIRLVCPGLPIGVSTTQEIDENLNRRVGTICAWSVLPDFASVNFWEAGATEIARSLRDRGVGIEAGVSTPADVNAFLSSGLQGRCVRVLIEVLWETNVEAALVTADHLLSLLSAANVAEPRLVHGEDATAWPLLRWGSARGQQVRMGFEDVLTLPGGGYTSSNTDLIRAAFMN